MAGRVPGEAELPRQGSMNQTGVGEAIGPIGVLRRVAKPYLFTMMIDGTAVYLVRAADPSIAVSIARAFMSYPGELVIRLADRDEQALWQRWAEVTGPGTLPAVSITEARRAA